MKHRSIRTVAELSIYVALAFIFGYLENLFPIPMPVPGMKLGFANVITVIVLYRRNFRDALLVSLLRIILNAFTFEVSQFALQPGRKSVKSVCYDSYKRKTSLGPGQCQCCRRIANLGQFITAGLLVFRH
ncbi:MAG: Gx transporter family protein [Eubacterium sp.]